MSTRLKFTLLQPLVAHDVQVQEEEELEWFNTSTFVSILSTWPDHIPVPLGNIKETITKEQYNYVCSCWPKGVPMLEHF